MPSFQIRSYAVTTFLQRTSGDTSAYPTRALELRSAPMTHGIVNRAMLSFSRQFDVFTAPVAGYSNPPVGYEGLRIVGWFPLAEFSYYYDILRSESPVFFSYELITEGRLINYISRLGLYTNAEPVGEGPEDANSEERLSAMVSYINGPIDFLNKSDL